MEGGGVMGRMGWGVGHELPAGAVCELRLWGASDQCGGYRLLSGDLASSRGMRTP